MTDQPGPPVYECPVCHTRQPVEDVDQSDPPTRLSNATCRSKYGGCLRMGRLQLRPEATWDPGEWELACPTCDYETVAWGPVGFGLTDRWSCPDCESAMFVASVTQRRGEEQ